MNVSKINPNNIGMSNFTKKPNLNPKLNNSNVDLKIPSYHLVEADEFDYGIAKSNLKNKLKDTELLYEMYSGKDVTIPKAILENNDFMAELYQDVGFMKASNAALLRATADKLQNETLSDDDRNELLFLNNLLAVQKELFDNPDNSFENGVGVKLQDKIAENDSRGRIVTLEPQLAFGSIFNYGFINKPKTRRQKAEAIVNRQATKAAAKSALLLQVSTALETVALTENTFKMCRKICETYEMPGAAVTSLISQITGAMAGKTAASWALKWFPGAGNAANATITYSLHQIQGRAIIAWCEANYKNKNIKDWDAAAKTFFMLRSANAAFGNPVDSYVDAFGSEEGLSDFINTIR